MRISEARTEVLMEELQLDIIDYLRSQVGETNDDALHRTIANDIAEYLTQFDELDHAVVICDRSNNPESAVLKGRLTVDVKLLIDGKEVPGTFLVGPGEIVDIAEVGGSFVQPQVNPRSIIMNEAARTLTANWSITPEDIADAKDDLLYKLDEGELDWDDDVCPCHECEMERQESANFLPNLEAKMAKIIADEIDEEIFQDLMKAAGVVEEKAPMKINYFSFAEMSQPPRAEDFAMLNPIQHVTLPVVSKDLIQLEVSFLQDLYKPTPKYPDMPSGLASTLGL